MKLVCVIAVVCAAGPNMFGMYFTVVAFGAVSGIFVAEHFADTKPREFFAITLIPFVSATLASLIPLLQSSESVSPAEFGITLTLGAMTGIMPAAVSVVAISIASALIHRTTGVQLLKYDWSESGATRVRAESASQK
ncbi:MAG: hypothetical protein AAFX06_05875 [Planctomycetota bacterium]